MQKRIEVIELSDDEVDSGPPVLTKRTAPTTSRYMPPTSSRNPQPLRPPHLQPAQSVPQRNLPGVRPTPNVTFHTVNRPPTLKPMVAGRGVQMPNMNLGIPLRPNERITTTITPNRMIPQRMEPSRRSLPSAGASVAIVNEKPLSLSDLFSKPKPVLVPPPAVSSRIPPAFSQTGLSSMRARPSPLKPTPSTSRSTVPGYVPSPPIIHCSPMAGITTTRSRQMPNQPQPNRPIQGRQQIPSQPPPPTLQPQITIGQRQQNMPRLNPMHRAAASTANPRTQQQTRLPPPVNYNQTKFKKTSTNPQAVAIKNRVRRRNAASTGGATTAAGVAAAAAPVPAKKQPTTAESRKEAQMRQMQRRKHQMEMQKLATMKGLVLEVLDARYHDNDSYEGAFLCGFGGCSQRLHNNINYFYHMWAHLARVLPYDYNESGKYSTTGGANAQKRSELDHWAQCPQCFAEFDGIHKKSVHYHVVHSLSRVSDKFQTLSVCNICEMTVNSGSELTHLKQHVTKKGTMEVPYTCKKCKYRSSTRMQLFKHYEERHANTNHLVCPVCTQAFNVPNNQKLKTIVFHEAYCNHIMRHFNEKSTRCPRCAIKMLVGTPSEKEKYQRHVKSHYDEVKIPPRLKQLTKQFSRAEYKKSGRRIFPRKSSHRCAFCPKPHIDPNNMNSRTFRRSCKNKTCNFTSTCKQEFQLHKIICTRKLIRKANGTYVPVVRPSVPMKAPPRTERNMYQCERCQKVMEVANLGNPDIANHMIMCGSHMKVVEPPKQFVKVTEREALEEKFETFVFGLRRMENIRKPEPKEKEKQTPKIVVKREKDPWEDVCDRAMRVANTKSLGLQESETRIKKLLAMVNKFEKGKKVEQKEKKSVVTAGERSSKQVKTKKSSAEEPKVAVVSDSTKKTKKVSAGKVVPATKKSSNGSEESRDSTISTKSSKSSATSKSIDKSAQANKNGHSSKPPEQKLDRKEKIKSVLQGVFAAEKLFQVERAKRKAKREARLARSKAARQNKSLKKEKQTSKQGASRDLFSARKVSSRGRVIKKIVRTG
ncbi:hypothetical protein QR680_001210 [Steinernema hermaphroditum]|uniref:C2H2-type domain-containing protein n=1 Tax=Steinernema hermaphroditum TaxID=289476 RepID=A0AA39LF04_9BILA|nr:hypothetical protein QR680_001210 [Steinernema hermaphroditum]